jgi:hypothetical protein
LIRVRRARLLVALVLTLGACSDGDDTTDGTAAPETTSPTPTFTGDGSPFCDAMLGVGQVGGDPDASPEEVLAANQTLVGYLDEAQANTPADAPADFDALLDDYRAATQAIVTAGGDVEAAFAALERDSPDLVERLGSSTSHQEGYDFLVDRCGITQP